MAKEIKTVRTIALSEETAELFDCKKKLDECFVSVLELREDMYGCNRDFESKWYDAFSNMNDIILELITEQMQTKGTESHYKVI